MGKKNGRKGRRSPVVPPPIQSRRKARQVTTRFHQLHFKLQALEADSRLTAGQKLRCKESIELEMEKVSSATVFCTKFTEHKYNQSVHT